MEASLTSGTYDKKDAKGTADRKQEPTALVDGMSASISTVQILRALVRLVEIEEKSPEYIHERIVGLRYAIGAVREIASRDALFDVIHDAIPNMGTSLDQVDYGEIAHATRDAVAKYIAEELPRPEIRTAIKWSPADDSLGKIVKALADGDKTFGYGHGPLNETVFGSKHGDVTLAPRDTLVVYKDGTTTVIKEQS